MPELPEVETVVRDLRKVIAGKRIIRVKLNRADVVRHPSGRKLVAELEKRVVVEVRRRGKFICCDLDDRNTLVFHLGMTGHLTVCTPIAKVVPHTHFVADLSDGKQVRFDDARRFGRIALGDFEELQELGAVPKLGVEPLSLQFNGKSLLSLTVDARRAIKALLLDQEEVAGIGNIYADEICFAARIRPDRLASTLRLEDCVLIASSAKEILRASIKKRGTTFSDFRDVWGSAGRNGDQLAVYGRDGEGCERCGKTLVRASVAGRGTTLCTQCQR
jgi:formamidopyrimidine-DNA glycosylase